MNDYIEVSEELNSSSKVITKKEEYLRLALEWHTGILYDGYETTARNFFDSLNEYKEAFLHLEAVKNAEYVEQLRQLLSSSADIKIPEANENDLEVERIQKIDEAILERKSNSKTI